MSSGIKKNCSSGYKEEDQVPWPGQVLPGDPAGIPVVAGTGTGPSRLILNKCPLNDDDESEIAKKLRQIRKLPWLQSYYRDAFLFINYLIITARLDIAISGVCFDEWGDLEDVYKVFGYPHRWKDNYRKAIISKFYQLDEWFKEHKPVVTMITFTTYHDWRKPYIDKKGVYHPALRVRDGYSIERSFELLTDGWQKMRKVLRRCLGKFSYLWVLEPTKMGYPHMHLLVFCAVPKDVQDKIKHMWSDCYGIAGKDYGVDFTVKQIDGIESIRNYLMKYLEKSFYQEDLTPCHLVYNALLRKRSGPNKKKSYRMWDSSQDLKSVMKYRKKKNQGVTWIETELVTDEGERKTLWEIEYLQGNEEGQKAL